MEIDVCQPGKINIGKGFFPGSDRILNLTKVLVENTSELDFKIGVCLFGNGIPAAVDEEGLQSVHCFAGDEHHPCEWLADYAVQRNQNGERDQRPDAAGHRVNTLFPVELLHLLIELLLVPCMAGLNLLDSGLKPGRLHCAFLALGHKRCKNHVHREAEKNQRNAVVAGPVVELQHQPCKGSCNSGPHRKLLSI